MSSQNDAIFPREMPLRTSNMTYDVFEDYCILLNINTIDFELRKFFIDKSLVDNRNRIAHGKFLPINLIDFNDIYKGTIELLNKFKTSIMNSAALNKYLKAS